MHCSAPKLLCALTMDTAMALLADGGVQFQLHPAHPGMPEDHPLTEDNETGWRTAGTATNRPIDEIPVG